MTSSFSYMAILKGKNAEFRALSQIPADLFASMIILFDIPRPTNPNKVDNYLIDIAEKINAATRLSGPFYLDLFDIDPQLRTAGGLIPLTFLLQCFRHGLFPTFAIPVTGLKRGNSFNSELAKEITIDGHGVCLRLLREDMELPRFLDSSVNEVLDIFSITDQNCDFLLDFRHLRTNEVKDAAKIAVSTINNLEQRFKCRTLFLAASGFPDSFSQIGSFDFKWYRKTELDLWQTVCSNAELSRKPIFSDYGATHPRTVYYDKKAGKRMSGNIRLTIGDNFRLGKGGPFTKYGSDQYRDLAKMVLNDQEVNNHLYGPVRETLKRCAMDMIKPGYPGKWIEIGTVQHLVDTSNGMVQRAQSL